MSWRKGRLPNTFKTRMCWFIIYRRCWTGYEVITTSLMMALCAQMNQMMSEKGEKKDPR